ncbi:hypothetical protein O181_026548 [Austropuccinia psidii MF-1]|uniref:Uncharacterized protein n=1 Tax=Austropuccinia psidii MF-1 TaxID=1389203 RepID=A0A9Q3H036_9BASI|nr:hypothetical protein [Austropuccinia psidii MF-1]
MITPNRHMPRWEIETQEYRESRTIVHESGNIHRNADGFGRFELPNKPDDHASVPTKAEHQIPIEGVEITDLGT